MFTTVVFLLTIVYSAGLPHLKISSFEPNQRRYLADVLPLQISVTDCQCSALIGLAWFVLFRQLYGAPRWHSFWTDESSYTSCTRVFVQRCENKWYVSLVIWLVMSGLAILYSHNTLFQTSSAPCPLHIMALVVLSVFKPSYKCPFRFFHKLGMQHFISQQKPFSISFMLFLVNAKKRKDLKAADAVHWESLADRFPVCQVICLCVCCSLWCCI